MISIFGNSVATNDIGTLYTALLRSLLAIPGHTCNAIFMGYYLSLAKQFHYKKNRTAERNNLYLSILIPTLLHGIYDFCVMSGYQLLIIVFFGFITVLYIISIRKLKQIAKANKKIVEKTSFCIKCGGKIQDTFCLKCGARQE